MKKTKKKWLYKKNGRFYGDFRSFADVGGGQEALKPDGDRYATKDYRVAKALAKTRLAELRISALRRRSGWCRSWPGTGTGPRPTTGPRSSTPACGRRRRTPESW